ncbi:Asp23/Gls24 family envelope stress response protein [Streptomyces sp. NPDC046215]|uniref:Asp23/Gls24 family envelope stress response protein n=1 Tax=Streptomyces TaxID=1883 RepID=UPI0031D5B5B1
MEPADRGATRIADRVVAKIASQAAREALSDTAEEEHAPPHATVAVREDSARVRVSVELGYPTDIGGRCRAVRGRVTERVRALVGMEVPEVAVTVERLHSPHTLSAGRERVR